MTSEGGGFNRSVLVENGATVIEISATLPTVKLQAVMSALEKAVLKVDGRLSVFWSQWPGNAALSHSTGSKRHTADRQLPELPAPDRSLKATGFGQQYGRDFDGLGTRHRPLAVKGHLQRTQSMKMHKPTLSKEKSS